MDNIKNKIQKEYLEEMCIYLMEKEIDLQNEIDSFWDKVVNNLGMTKEEWENL